YRPTRDRGGTDRAFLRALQGSRARQMGQSDRLGQCRGGAPDDRRGYRASKDVSLLARAAYSYPADPAVPKFPHDRPIVVFYGYCALCTGFAQFVLRHDHAAKFRLLAAQSPLGHALYVHYGLDPLDYETNILIADGIAWFKSEAAVRIAEGLG